MIFVGVLIAVMVLMIIGGPAQRRITRGVWKTTSIAIQNGIEFHVQIFRQAQSRNATTSFALESRLPILYFGLAIETSVKVPFLIEGRFFAPVSVAQWNSVLRTVDPTLRDALTTDNGEGHDIFLTLLLMPGVQSLRCSNYWLWVELDPSVADSWLLPDAITQKLGTQFLEPLCAVRTWLEISYGVSGARRGA